MSQNLQMREYETIYIMKPTLDDKKATSVIHAKKELIEKLGGKNIQVSSWGRKKIAWERKKETRGIFVHHKYLASGSAPQEFDRNLSIDDDILLRQTVVTAHGIDPETVVPQEDSLSFAPVRERKEHSSDHHGKRHASDNKDRQDS